MGKWRQRPRGFFHLHIPHLHSFHHHEKKDLKDIPKGCLAILVGQGEEQQRFVIPVIYINHPLFKQLLNEAEEEYGFDQKGPITIPCHVEEFRNVQSMIDKNSITMSGVLGFALIDYDSHIVNLFDHVV